MDTPGDASMCAGNVATNESAMCSGVVAIASTLCADNEQQKHCNKCDTTKAGAMTINT